MFPLRAQVLRRIVRPQVHVGCWRCESINGKLVGRRHFSEYRKSRIEGIELEQGAEKGGAPQSFTQNAEAKLRDSTKAIYGVTVNERKEVLEREAGQQDHVGLGHDAPPPFATENLASTERSRVIFSGIQPTGVPHLGNYLGALRGWVDLQDQHPDQSTKLLFSIVDLHAITVRQDPALLKQRRKEMLASLMAVGLESSQSILFCQSSVKAHAELMWILSCHASMGYLSRMTQWKSKMQLPTSASPFDAPPSSNSREALKLGLFSYPVLQAADILLYGTTHVPVGEDQAQHLEFTRDLANSFNIAHNKTIFQLPETILSPAKRVMSLKEPSKKMSKSDANEMSRILITDPWEMIKKKVNGAITDSIEGITYDRQARPGVSNLIDLMFYMDESSYASPEVLARDLEHVSLKALKEKVAEKIEGSIKPVREKYEWLIQEDQTSPFLWNLNVEAARRAEKLAEQRLRRVKEALGLVGF